MREVSICPNSGHEPITFFGRATVRKVCRVEHSLRRVRVRKLTASIRSVPTKVWNNIGVGKSRVREVVELLCGALWHLRYALELGELDSTPVRYRDEHSSLWKEWLGTRGRISRAKPQLLVQSLLVSDACLRLAGAQEIFRKGRENTQPLFSTFECIEKKREKDCATTLDLSIRRIIIHRDAFMHGEFPNRSNEPRRRARKPEMLSDTYNVAQLFDDCLDVGDVLAEAVQS